MRKTIFAFLLICVIACTAYAQNSIIEGYIFEDGNRGYLNEVAVKIFKKSNNKLITSALTNKDGFFSAQVSAGTRYEISTEKDFFKPQKIILFVKRSDKNKKVFTKIKMFRNQQYLSEKITDRKNVENQEHFVARSGAALSPELAKAVKEYGVDGEKIRLNVNQDGVTFAQEMNINDPYAEVTNATRLADANYDEASDREAMKRQPMPTAYKPTVKIDQTRRVTNSNNNQRTPSDYEQAAASRKILDGQPRLGETMVANATTQINTRIIPNYYTGYKVEFLTALSELPVTHEIFNRHGNIVLEKQANSIYSYMLGDFQNKQMAETFLKEHLLEKYPMANLVYYYNGKRERKIGQKIIKTKPASAPPR